MSTSSTPEGPQGPEYLEQGGGAPLSQGPSGGSDRKKVLVVGGAVAGLALVGGGVWAAMSFFGQGPQPAEALPASTLGYAAIDLDPSGGQKVEALQMLKKFPVFEDEVGLDTDDDIVERIFDEAGVAEQCPDLSYADDVKPWLGARFAVAAMDLGEAGPTIAAVLQVTDAEAAEDGLSKLSECAGEDAGGFTVEGEWAVLAETSSIAEDVVEAGNKDPLVEDDEYVRWTEEVGDAGVVNMYAAPEAGQYYAETLGNMAGLVPGAQDPGAPEPGTPDELLSMLEDFEGAAATLRFDDGALELQLAGDATLTQEGMPVSDGGDDVLSTLPADTAAALGVGFTDGWFSQWMEQTGGAGMGLEQMMLQLEAETGLSLPEDVETLVGDSAAVAISSDVDVDALVNSSTPEGLPIGLKVQGDAEEIEAVLDKLRASLGPDAAFIVSQAEGDTVSISASEDYLAQLAEEGELGESDTFQNVVREAEDAASILYVDFDASNDWLVEMAGGDPVVGENLEPLEGLGLSGWVDDEVGHVVLRVTTD